MRYSFSLLGLTKGANECICPLVSCTGGSFPGARAQISVFPSCVAWKTKYLPFGVQLPQHSDARWSRVAGKRFAPLADSKTSHNDDCPVALSKTVSRRREPSGDHRNHEPVPGNVASCFASLPSLRARYTTVPSTNAISRPSGDQVAVSAAVRPARLSASPGSDKIQRGGAEPASPGVPEGEVSGPDDPTNNSLRFGAISRMYGACSRIGRGVTSPPLTEA